MEAVRTECKSCDDPGGADRWAKYESVAQQPRGGRLSGGNMKGNVPEHQKRANAEDACGIGEERDYPGGRPLLGEPSLDGQPRQRVTAKDERQPSEQRGDQAACAILPRDSQDQTQSSENPREGDAMNPQEE